MSTRQYPEPGTEEWTAQVERETRQFLFNRAVSAATDGEWEQLQRGHERSSWEEIDLSEHIEGNIAIIAPKWLRRADGNGLLYPGCTHSIHGPTGHGKSWTTQLAMAQALMAGQHVLCLDYESNPNSVVQRLLSLGVPKDVLREQFHYYQPMATPDLLKVDRTAFEDMISREYAIAVIDGANISMMRCGLKTNVAEDVARWHDLIMLPIAEKTGAAVVATDHVPKGDNRDGLAIGSQHKIAGLTGAGFIIEKVAPFGRGRHGIATVRVGEKDREGFVHQIGITDDAPEGMLVAELHIDATCHGVSAGSVIAELRVPTTAVIDQAATKRSKPKAGVTAVSRPVREMEAVSAYWEEMAGSPEATTTNKTVATIRARQMNGITPVMAKHRLEDAIVLLIDPKTEGGPYARVEAVKVRGGEAHHHIHLKRYHAGEHQHDGVVFKLPSKQQQEETMALK